MRHQYLRRERICRGRKGTKSRICVYVRRNAKGQIVKVHNINRSIRVDARVRAKRRLFGYKDRGYGDRGDWR